MNKNKVRGYLVLKSGVFTFHFFFFNIQILNLNMEKNTHFDIW